MLFKFEDMMGKRIYILIVILIAGNLSCNSLKNDNLQKRLVLPVLGTVVPPPPEGAFQLSQFGITWYFDAEYEYGQFANGDYWVVGPVHVIYIDPLSYRSMYGRVKNGSMINPSPRNGSTQGYDSSMHGKYGPNYDPDLNAAMPGREILSEKNPLILQPNTSLISTISLPDAGNRPQWETAAILTVLDSAPPAGSFRPPYCGSDKTIRFNVDDLRSGLLQRLPPVPETPGLGTVERYFERPWIDHVPNWSA